MSAAGNDRAAGARPLSRYRVVELCSTIAGPVCARLFADFGADVVKVERPEGDAARNRGYHDEGVSLSCASMLRNERTVCADLKTPGGLEVVRGLIARTDFAVEKFRPGTLGRLGLGYDTLSRDNPVLILVRISGDGQSGPDSHLPGYGAICEAVAGVRHLTGDPDRPPARVALAATDYLTAVYAAFGALLALEQCHRTGRGQIVDTALYEAAFFMVESVVPAHARQGVVPTRQGPRLMNSAPTAGAPPATAVGCCWPPTMTRSSAGWRGRWAIPGGSTTSVGPPRSRAGAGSTRWMRWWPAGPQSMTRPTRWR